MTELLKGTIQGDERFLEVSARHERFIGCPDCGRNFISKPSYNIHVPDCKKFIESVSGNCYPVSQSDSTGRTATVHSSNRKDQGRSANDNIKIQQEQAAVLKEQPVDENTPVAIVLTTHTGSPMSTLPVMETSDLPESSYKSRTVKSNESYECSVCNKIYYTKYGFKLHLRTHTGEKGYICDICGKSFSQSGHLKDHRRIHTGEKPFTCPICQKKFAQNQNLKHHLRMHSGIRPYQCKLCDKSFFTKCELATHKRSHSGVKPFPCDSCDKTFGQIQGLRAHLRSHGENESRQHMCSGCKLKFDSQESFINHLMTHHSQT